MASNARHDIYFESITLSNLIIGIFWSLRGYRIYYCSLGRVFRKIPFLRYIAQARFIDSNFWVSDYQGLSFNIHHKSLECAEHLYQQLVTGNAVAFHQWERTFQSPKVHLYVKKKIATESWNLIKIYLVLSSMIRAGNPPIRLVVLDSAMNRIMVPWLVKQHEEPELTVRGLGHVPWQWLQSSLDVALSTATVFGSVLLSIWHGGLRLRRQEHRFKLSKEIRWGIGEGTPKRNDDFMVDGETIPPEDVLFFYRKGTSLRRRILPMVADSLTNAKTKGYKIVVFDRVPVPLSVFWHSLLPRYMVFPTIICLLSLMKQLVDPSAGYLNRTTMSFLRRSVGWEIFLASYSPEINLAQDEPDSTHLADTVALNLHGSRNAGFQWADMTQWRAVTLAYVGYNLYFAWGSLSEKYWNGNWEVDEVVHTGYLWAHAYQENLLQRESQRTSLNEDASKRKFVVSLMDEKPDPDLYTSNKMLYDFYKIGVELLKSRSDVTILAKPKRAEGIRDFPEILELVAPVAGDGRFQIWDMMSSSVQQVMAMSDVVVSMAMGSPYLEAACCRRIGLNYAPIGNHSSRVYSEGLGKIIFDNVEDLVAAISWILDHPEYDPWEGLEELRNDLDPYRDTQGMDRLRKYISNNSSSNRAGEYSDLAFAKVPEEVS